MDIPEGLHGAHRRHDLIERVGRYRVEQAVEQGALRRLWTGVLVSRPRYLDPLTRAAAALLAHGPAAALAGPTAAALHGCTAIDTARTHVIVPYGHSSRSRAGLVVHNGPLPPDDIEESSGLRTLSLERVIADLLCTARARDALAVTDQALAMYQQPQREQFRAALDGRLSVRRDPRGTKRGAQLLGLATGRAESAPESWLLLELVSLGFPVPEVNWSLRSPSGSEVYRLDLAWPEQRIAVEYNGYSVHVDQQLADQRRLDDLRRRGWIVIVATSADLANSYRLQCALRVAFERRGAWVRVERPA
ncbi:MAG TPA: hypothetical protein VGH89_22185 [Pseudonocardia sp.]|jgi:hypothetical protein